MLHTLTILVSLVILSFTYYLNIIFVFVTHIFRVFRVLLINKLSVSLSYSHFIFAVSTFLLFCTLFTLSVTRIMVSSTWYHLFVVSLLVYMISMEKFLRLYPYRKPQKATRRRTRRIYRYLSSTGIS